METKHIRMNQEEVIFAKKEILHSQINTLHLIKRLRNYKILRRKELNIRTKLKQEMGFLRSKINLMISTMPREASEKQTRGIQRESPFKEKVNNDLQKELDDIKAKLARLE